MPGLDGVEVCRKLRSTKPEPYTYILLVTGRNQIQDIVEALQAGADDYLFKPFDAGELRARLMVGARILNFQEELLSARESLRFQVMHDPLTQLLNRAGILDIFQRELARAQRAGTPLGVILADVDHFKTINDRYGHLAGDRVLREVASRMRSSVRTFDHIGRYGGEEFLILAPDCEPSGALALAERMRHLVGQRSIDAGMEALHVTISLGAVATNEQQTAEALLHAADDALYAAKRNGRNRVELAQPATAGSSGEATCVTSAKSSD
jgi:diguanylate cyclase (GGDEF)-like protein